MKSKQSLSTHVANGHGARGRFAPGNKLGKGNPFAGQAAKLRAELFNMKLMKRPWWS